MSISARLLVVCLAAVVGGGLAALSSSRCAGENLAAAAPDDRPATRPKNQAAVLVELFTSQGCSSCPPADRLLSALSVEADGVDVLPLAFHVDYWNRLGWADPFSRAAWTARQERYAAAAIAGGRLYTPQLVVQGGEHVVGSAKGEIGRLIRRAARRQEQGARVSARARRVGDRVIVAIDARLAPGSRPADVQVALSESGLSTPVTHGENQGRALVNDFVVRRLERGFRVQPGASRAGNVEIPLAASWRRDRLAVTVFLQDPDGMAVLAAARAPLQ